MPRFFPAVPLVIAVIAPILALFSLTASAECQQIVIVRHAEKAEDGTSDPPLSHAGAARAEQLARMLRGANVLALYATQYRRTQQTLEPLSRDNSLPVEIRPIENGNANKQATDIANEVRQIQTSGTVVIAGHSNTVDDLAAAFTETSIDELDHSDYDSLFLIRRCEDDTALLLRQTYSGTMSGAW